MPWTCDGAGVVRLLVGLDPGLIPGERAFEIDLAVVAVAAMTAACATVLSGVIPAVMIASGSPGGTLRSRTGDTPGSSRTRATAAACQVAGALLLVYGSAMLVHTVWRWQQTDYGFTRGGVLTFAVTLPPRSYAGPDTWVTFWDSLREDVAALPGVEVAAVASDLPMAGSPALDPYLPAERAADTAWGARTALHRSVSPGYFDAAGIRLLEGRAHAGGDREGAPIAVVVDEEIARQLRRDREGPIVGRRLDVTRYTFRGRFDVERTPADVIGVVSAVPHDHPDAPPAGTIYLSHAQYPLRGMYLLLRGSRGVVPEAGLARAALHDLDPALAAFRVRTLDEIVAAKLAPTRFVLALIAALATAVTALVGVALFGVVAETVRQRWRDLGIRLALGATARGVTRGVLAGTAVPVTVGLAVGAALSPAIGHLIAGTIESRDTWSGPALATAVLAILAVGFASCYPPARRAGRIDPLKAIRHE